MSDICQRCGEDGKDRRTLWMYCLYDMNELGLPFQECRDTHAANEGRRFYTLLVCKECRSDWMHAIKRWFETKPVREEDEDEGGIYIRDFGATRKKG